MKGKKLIYGHIQFSGVVITNSYGNAFWGTVRINIPASFGISNFHTVTATVHSDFGLLTCSVKWIEKKLYRVLYHFPAVGDSGSKPQPASISLVNDP